MNKYLLRQTAEGDIYFDHNSCMYPVEFENEINKIAGEKITKFGPQLGGFFGGFINCFVVKSDKKDVFFKKVFPSLGKDNQGKNGCWVWSNTEMAEANQI